MVFSNVLSHTRERGGVGVSGLRVTGDISGGLIVICGGGDISAGVVNFSGGLLISGGGVINGTGGLLISGGGGVNFGVDTEIILIVLIGSITGRDISNTIDVIGGFLLGSLNNVFNNRFNRVVLGFNVVGIFIEVSSGFNLTGLSINGSIVISGISGVGGGKGSSGGGGGVSNGSSVSGGGSSVCGGGSSVS